MRQEKTSLFSTLLRQPMTIIGMLVIILAVVVALLGANIRPDESKDANIQQLSLAKLKPLSLIKFIVIPSSLSKEHTFLSKTFFGGNDNFNTYLPFDSLFISHNELHYYPYQRQRGDTPQAFKTLALANVIAPDADSVLYTSTGFTISQNGKSTTYNYNQAIELLKKERIITRYFLLGTDTFGRDLLSRLMAGTIVSLSVGFIAVLVSLLLGIVIGGLAGYYRGWIDTVIMWFVNVIWSVPTLLMVIAITVALGKGFTQVFIAVGFTMWVEVARVVRGQFMQLREKDYITAAKLMGFSDWRIIFKHMLPNAMAPLIVISAGNFSTAILLESGLSFLGVGAQVPMPSWGGIIKAHFNYITTDYAYLALLPGACLSLLTLAFMLLGNGLRDALDVKGN